jgi:hypothetical protein
MKIKTNVKAGLTGINHNETHVRDSKQAAGLRVKTRVKAGLGGGNHNEALVSE